MEKINVAELLKDCPSGMELDCTIFDDVYFDYIDDVSDIINCYIQDSTKKIGISFSKYGCYSSISKSKCVIFPKGKTTWEGFVPPCKFKEGDVVTWKDGSLLVACIYKERKNSATFNHHIALYKGGFGIIVNGEITSTDDKFRFATEEEKEKLFQAIKDNGYNWNAETKTLEKLIEPKFKVGDRITNGKVSITIGYIDDNYYYEFGRIIANRLFIKNQDDWKLVSNKFDITTLKPFESRVLVRDSKIGTWKPAYWGCYDKTNNMNYPYVIVGGSVYGMGIPYEGNEHLLGTTNDCDEFYKTWEL